MSDGVNVAYHHHEVERLTAEIKRLKAENEAAIREVEQSTKRWATLTSTRQADKAEIERWQHKYDAAVQTGWQKLQEAEAEIRRLLRDGEATVDLIVDDVVNLEYDTCDEAQPDLMHVTRDELSIILRRHILGEE